MISLTLNTLANAMYIFQSELQLIDLVVVDDYMLFIEIFNHVFTFFGVQAHDDRFDGRVAFNQGAWCEPWALVHTS